MLLLWMLRTRMLHERPVNRETANKLNPSTRRRRSLFTFHFSSPKSRARRDQTTSPTTHSDPNIVAAVRVAGLAWARIVFLVPTFPGELEWKNVETYVLEKNIQNLQYPFSSS